MTDSLIEARLRVFQAWFIGAIAMGIAVFVLSVAFMLYATISIQGIARENQSALCALRNDIQVRHDSGVRLLKANPDGLIGLPASQIQQSLDNQKSTLRALSVLNC